MRLTKSISPPWNSVSHTERTTPKQQPCELWAALVLRGWRHSASKPFHSLQLYRRGWGGWEAESLNHNPGSNEKLSSLEDWELSGKWPCSSYLQTPRALLFWEDHKVFCQDSDQLLFKLCLCGLCRYVQGCPVLAWSYYSQVAHRNKMLYLDYFF